MHRRSLLRRACVLAAAGIAGCSSDGDDTGDSTPTDTMEPTATATSTQSRTAATTDTRSETPTGTGTPSPEERTAQDDGTATPTATDTATPTPTPTDTATPTPTPIPADQRVEVGPDGKFRFSPEEFEIQVGETVGWIWEGSGHNVKPDSIPSDSDWSGTPGERTKRYDSGYTYTHTFETTGTYEYVCVPHQSVGMEGSFTVVE